MPTPASWNCSTSDNPKARRPAGLFCNFSKNWPNAWPVAKASAMLSLATDKLTKGEFNYII